MGLETVSFSGVIQDAVYIKTKSRDMSSRRLHGEKKKYEYLRKLIGSPIYDYNGI